MSKTPTLNEVERFVSDALKKVSDELKSQMADGRILVIEGVSHDERVQTKRTVSGNILTIESLSERDDHWIAYTQDRADLPPEAQVSIKEAIAKGGHPIIIKGSDGSQVRGLMPAPPAHDRN